MKLNLGGGRQARPGWLTIDAEATADVRLDLRRPLPFADGSCSAIYSEHAFEHLAYPGHAELLLRECHRVLEPDGILLIGVPDTEWPLRCYVTGGGDYFEWSREEESYPAWNKTRLDQINFHFRQQLPVFGLQHLYAYDLETLTARLTEAGFVDVRPRPYDPAQDSPARRVGTIYACARRPAAAATRGVRLKADDRGTLARAGISD